MRRFSENSRVCFIGDSITAAGLYTEFIAEHYAKKLSSSGVRFYVGAVPGGTARSQNVYFEEDILVYKPDHAIVMLGTNDSSSGQLARPRNDKIRYTILYDCFENYKANLNRLIDRLEQNNITVTLCSPPPYAEFQECDSPNLRGGCALMTAYADYCRYLAEKRGLEFCDVHSYLTREMQFADLFANDRIHPNVLGHHKIAECILTAMGFNNYEAKPLSEVFAKRAEIHGKISNIYVAERLILGEKRYEISLEKKYEFLKDYLKNNRYPDNYYKNIASQFLENRPNLNEIREEYIKRTDIIMGFEK